MGAFHHKKINDPFLFIILDGFGLGDTKKKGNAITPATAPFLFSCMKKYPFTTLSAHGEAVGLFPGQEGNSEAGHFNIGAGRVVEQDVVRISSAIRSGEFFELEEFENAYKHAKKNKSAIHLMGLLSNGQSAHSRPEHLYALLDFFARKKYPNVFLHLFTDGRDAPPQSALNYAHRLSDHLHPGQKIATLMGRFYAMDRGKNWSRTELAYKTLLGENNVRTAASVEEALKLAYKNGETDEYILPTVLLQKGKPVGRIKSNDTIIFFNARSDRARQVTKAFVQKDFEEVNPHAFHRHEVLHNIYFVAMTNFGPDLPGVSTAFQSIRIRHGLCETIGDKYQQVYISETEKYAHVTYFINGGHAEPVNGEDRVLIHSKKVMSYAQRPQMEARQITRRILKYLKKNEYDFICVNFPNADMVGHTGNYFAAKRAVRILDRCVQKLVKKTLQQHGIVVITADHGNAEEMIDPETHQMWTEHTIHPVPFLLIDQGHDYPRLRSKGILADVAPTILKVMKIKQPKDMTGKPLF